MNIITIIASILATYAISTVITGERGPFGVFSRIRNYFEAKAPRQPIAPVTKDETIWQAYQDEFAEYEKAYDKFHYTLWGYAYALATCPVCLGFYAAGFVILWQGDGLIMWLAVYGGHLVLLKVIKE